MYHNKLININEDFKKSYILYNPHNDGKILDIRKLPFIITLAIDPGSRNFALRKQRRENKDGKLCITPLIFDRIDMKLEDCNVIEATHRYLNNIYESFKDCHLIIVEKQLAVNYTMVRISQAVISYFMTKMANNDQHSIIMEIDAKMKGRMLGAGNMTKRQLKQWSVQMATQILTIRGDNISLNILSRHNKKDDLCDCILEEEAAWILLMT